MALSLVAKAYPLSFRRLPAVFPLQGVPLDFIAVAVGYAEGGITAQGPAALPLLLKRFDATIFAASPGIYETLEVVGRERTLARLRAAVALVDEAGAQPD